MNSRKALWICTSCGHETAQKPGRKRTCPQCQNVGLEYFASALEARRYRQLRLELRLGAIHALELHPRFPCAVGRVEICTYVADFQYRDTSGMIVVEDCKGLETDVFILKKRLVEALYPEIKVSLIRKA
jgi:Protein of unknown function (DUF1064)